MYGLRFIEDSSFRKRSVPGFLDAVNRAVSSPRSHRRYSATPDSARFTPGAADTADTAGILPWFSIAGRTTIDAA
jgi:hypothetical protein